MGRAKTIVLCLAIVGLVSFIALHDARALHHVVYDQSALTARWFQCVRINGGDAVAQHSHKKIEIVPVVLKNGSPYYFAFDFELGPMLDKLGVNFSVKCHRPSPNHFYRSASLQFGWDVGGIPRRSDLAFSESGELPFVQWPIVRVVNKHVARDTTLGCGGVSDVGDINVDFDTIPVEDEPSTRASQVCGNLSFANFPSGIESFASGFGGGFGFLDHFVRGISGPPSVTQGEANEHQTGEANDNASDSCPEHAFCPESHLLLSFQVAYILILLPLTIFLVFLGYQQAYRGLYAFERRAYLYGYWACVSGGLLACGSALLLPGWGYWLAFEGGLTSLL